ncbi:MAG: 3-isopropylmalate dehydratase small subunit [Paracoccus sp.]|nr:3-isopropylmalate dehydratase small subunit [Paracoccus sp. (in: a-proteobacteria)]
MAGWTRLEGMAAGLSLTNVDTDQIIPARFMSAPRSQGYGGFLLHDLRFGPDGGQTNLVLDSAQILVARRNFGSGSSREAAVYALVDFGIRAVIAPSFGDIFAANAVNNGLLPARMDEQEVEDLLAQLAEPAPMSLDLDACTVTLAGLSLPFATDPVGRQKIMNGWDDIDLTASHHDTITAFARARRDVPWAWP